MARRARGYRSAPPTFRFTPGIVEHGEVMALTRRTFVVPDETPRPQGRRTMTVGRKTYSWDTSADTSPVKGGRVTDGLSDDDDGSAPMPVKVTHAGGYVRTGYVTSPDRGRTWEVQRTTDMGDAPLPRLARGQELRPKRERKGKASVPRQKSAPREKSDRDTAVRQYLDAKGLSASVVEITPAIRAAALEAIESERQRAEYAAA
jgi:hypothetical protein